MSIVPTEMVEVSCQGIVSLRGEAADNPLFMLKDAQQRSIAIPLIRLESELLQHTLGGNPNEPQSPQPYRNLILCLKKTGVELGAVHIHYNSEYDLPTHLILRSESGKDFEVSVSCCDGIIYSKITGIPIFVDEQLMATIGAVPSDSEINKVVSSAGENDVFPQWS
jgi:bifunctional DNase/RNase